jgi:hypothetical protein
MENENNSFIPTYDDIVKRQINSRILEQSMIEIIRLARFGTYKTPKSVFEALEKIASRYYEDPFIKKAFCYLETGDVKSVLEVLILLCSSLLDVKENYTKAMIQLEECSSVMVKEKKPYHGRINSDGTLSATSDIRLKITNENDQTFQSDFILNDNEKLEFSEIDLKKQMLHVEIENGIVTKSELLSNNEDSEKHD